MVSWRLHFLPEDTRTSNVTNNTLGVNSDDTISLNSGTIEKMTGDRIVLEDVIASYGDNDSEAGIMLENEHRTSTRRSWWRYLLT